MTAWAPCGANKKGHINHNFRNQDIENFYKAADKITQRGYYVFRMGSLVEKKFKNNGVFAVGVDAKNTTQGTKSISGNLEYKIEF